MPEIKDVWKSASDKLKLVLGDDVYKTWIAGIVPLQLNEKQDHIVCRLGIPNEIFAGWLIDNYMADIVNALETTLDSLDVEVQFEQGHIPEENEAPEPPKRKPTKDDASDEEESEATPGRPKRVEIDESGDDVSSHSILNKHYTFDNFVVGESNEFCHAACMAVAKGPGKSYNPLFIHGGVGLGKTHLVQAIAHQLLSKKKRARVECLSSEEFLNIYIEAMSHKRLPSFRRHYRSLDLLVIDDVQFFNGKEKFQEEFFHTFNTLYNSNKQVVLTSDKAPHELSGLEQRLVSRFEWGLTTEVSSPGLETRMAILKQKQAHQKFKLNDDIIYYIAQRITNNIRRLEGALMRLISYMSLTGREVTLDVVNEQLGAIFEEEVSCEITIEKIVKLVSENFDLRVADILGKKRTGNIAKARQVAMYLTRKLTTLSTPVIGEEFGRNHATILHAVQRVEKDCERDETLRHTLNRLERQLKSGG